MNILPHTCLFLRVCFMKSRFCNFLILLVARNVCFHRVQSRQKKDIDAISTNFLSSSQAALVERSQPSKVFHCLTATNWRDTPAGVHRGQGDAKLDENLTVLSLHSLSMTLCTKFHTDKSSLAAPQSSLRSNVTQAAIISHHSIPPQPARKR